MKIYRIVLASFGTAFVEADSVVETSSSITFVREGSVISKYPRSMIKSYGEHVPTRAVPVGEVSATPVSLG